jgi:hypothetical protein
MGVALYIKSFPKNGETVLSELKSLDFYDVDGDLAEHSKTGEIVVHNLDVIDVLISTGSLSNFDGIYLPLRDLGFYIFAIDNMNGYGYASDQQHEYSIAHNPEKVLDPIQTLIKMVESWNAYVHGDLDIDANRKALTLIEKFLQDSINRGDVVSFVWG